ncbi:MAG: hypothetical protein AAGA68_21435 [Pseudomonadota bacterium]
MAEQLKILVKNFGEDPQLRDRFKQDPEGVMQEHGLSDEHKDIVRKGDHDAIKVAAGEGSVHADFLII